MLSLQIQKLTLVLLGLDVNLDKVNLTITADANGGALGSLFCELAHVKVKLRTLSSAARRLTAAARRSGLSTADSGLGFAVPLQSSTTTATTAPCQVLDLVLGPVDLRLLGLYVHLDQVHLAITADANGGVLGSLFCQLASSKATLPTVP